ncbi:MAG: hypothetical protein H7062_01090 [Candidatus Saccharimonas sp.]|nr:hypothetical protein [Planctomycetaceae bacterium]
MNHDDSEDSPEVLREAARDVWAPKLAWTAVVVHAISSLIVGGWLYYLAPGYKKRLDDFGTELSSSAVFAIGVSDLFVNYWYAFAVFGAAALVVDYIATEWMTRMLGRRWAILTVLIITITILSHAIIGFVIFQNMMMELSLKNMIATLGG